MKNSMDSRRAPFYALAGGYLIYLAYKLFTERSTETSAFIYVGMTAMVVFFVAGVYLLYLVAWFFLKKYNEIPAEEETAAEEADGAIPAEAAAEEAEETTPAEGAAKTQALEEIVTVENGETLISRGKES